MDAAKKLSEQEVVTQPTAEFPSSRDTGARPWSWIQLLGFRLVFCYSILYSFPFPLQLIPGGDVLTKPYDKLWEIVAVWTGKHLLNLTVGPAQNGSGDKTFDYV